ncbi:MAG: type II toxin-antitoxin system HicA family toxin [Terriglobia bacterium]
MNSREVIKKLRENGWYEGHQAGSHKQFKHATQKAQLQFW